MMTNGNMNVDFFTKTTKIIFLFIFTQKSHARSSNRNGIPLVFFQKIYNDMKNTQNISTRAIIWSFQCAVSEFEGVIKREMIRWNYS